MLNEEVRHYHRWCTPSTLVDQERIEDFYASDVSISAGFFGTLVDHTGVFGRRSASPPRRRAPTARCSPSTARRARTSSCCACSRSSARRARARRPQHPSLDGQRDQGVRARLPLPAHALRRGVRGGAAAQRGRGHRRRCGAIPRRWPSSTRRRPTRGCARTRRRSPPPCTTPRRTRSCSSTRRGAGTCTSTRSCRRRAMDAGADLAVQSTHKLAGGLQQTGLIHWREGRVDSELMEEAFREYVTTSPELPPARLRRRGRAGAGRQRARGARRVHRAHERAEGGAARAAAAARPPRRPGRGSGRRRRTSRASTWSRRRSPCPATTSAGFAVSHALVERGIVIEKAGINTLTLITTFQLEAERGRGHRARAGGGPRRARARRRGRAPLPANPFRGHRRPARHAPVPRAPLRQVDRAGGAARGRPSAASRPRRSRSTRRASP